MRTSGMGPWLALRTLLTLGGFFVLLTFAVGDYLAPLTDKAAQLIRCATWANSVRVPPGGVAQGARTTAPSPSTCVPSAPMAG